MPLSSLAVPRTITFAEVVVAFCFGNTQLNSGALLRLADEDKAWEDEDKDKELDCVIRDIALENKLLDCWVEDKEFDDIPEDGVLDRLIEDKTLDCVAVDKGLDASLEAKLELGNELESALFSGLDEPPPPQE